MRVKLTWSLLVAVACLLGASNLAAKAEAVDNGFYTAKDKEFYLTPEQILFIRPGLEMEILDVVIPADRQTEVTFKLTDPAGLVLDRTGITTPGPVSTSFILAYIPAGEEAYMSYTQRVQTSPITGNSADQASTDSGGSYTEMGDGAYMYKFGTVLPEGYDADVTHTMGVYARRDLREFDLDRYVTNELEHFVPSGSSEAMPRSIVTTETCNGRCHDPIALHGGSRLEVGLCILCHNPNQDIDPDTGNSVDMPLMIHKIHMGEGLANGYNIIGYNQNDHDYSHVVYPAAITECESCHTGGTPTENFPMVATPAAALVCDYSGKGETTLNWEYTGNVEIQVRSPSSAAGKTFARGGKTGSAATGKWVKDDTAFDLYDADTMELIQTVYVDATVLGCVSNAPGSFRGLPGVEHTNWLDNPGAKACGACHDDIDFAAGVGHLAVQSDNSCQICHKPDTGIEFDKSVRGAHTVLYSSAQMPGVLVEFIDIKDTNPGDKPTVTFSVGGKNGNYNPADMNRVDLVLNGPNEDYDFYVSERMGRDGDAFAQGGFWNYTFSTALPMDAMGSYTVSMEGRVDVDVDFGDEVEGERDYAQNPSMAFAVTDTSATPRRMIVDNAKCESCHVSLSLHGGNRTEAQYCVTCHRPDLIDIAPVPESVNMKWMIHKIHRGAELENGYVVIRSRGTFDFSHIEFTGDLRNCDKCHVNNSQQVPTSEGLLPQLTPNFWWPEIEPAAAACLGCHDSDDTSAHAYVNTSFFGESCATCHGEGKDFAVDKVHAR